MKIMLLLPPMGFLNESEYDMPPLGLAYLAAVLEQNNIEVEIVDAHIEQYSWKKIEEKFIKSKPDIVGVTFTTETRFDGFKCIKLAKKTIPDAVVIAGGPHVTFTAQDTLANVPELDIICRREGESTILELVREIEKEVDLKSILGISFRQNGKIVHNLDRPFIKNLDDIPYPARHLLSMDKYDFVIDVPGKGKIKATNVMTSRGCPIGCCFCSTTEMWGRQFRARSPQNVVEEIEHIIDNYGIQGFWFFDDTFTMNKKRVDDICNLILDKELDISWFCDVRVDTIDKNILKKMKEAGCYSIAYGVESGSQRILDEVIGKKISLEQVKNVKKWCNELGILSSGLFIISCPTETYQEAHETLEFMKELGGENSINILKVYPGTRIESLAKQKGIIPEDFLWGHPNSQTVTMPSITGNAPLFIDQLTWEEICEILFEWTKISKYPIYKKLPQALKDMRSFGDLKRLTTMGKIYIKQKFIKY
jgi:anaerobic magnesium-protoporphyrin IX monomethyl ester cyclase